MIFINKINFFTKILGIISVFLLCYGYLCRYFSIYFFWESKSLGWILLFISTLILLFKFIQIKKENNKKAIIEKIGVGLIIVISTFKLILFITIFNSDAYSILKKSLSENANINAEIGKVNSFSLMLLGGIQKSVDSNGENVNATISLTIKGEWKYKDLTIYLSKSPESDKWIVNEIE